MYVRPQPVSAADTNTYRYWYLTDDFSAVKWPCNTRFMESAAGNQTAVYQRTLSWSGSDTLSSGKDEKKADHHSLDLSEQLPNFKMLHPGRYDPLRLHSGRASHISLRHLHRDSEPGFAHPP